MPLLPWSPPWYPNRKWPVCLNSCSPFSAILLEHSLLPIVYPPPSACCLYTSPTVCQSPCSGEFVASFCFPWYLADVLNTVDPQQGSTSKLIVLEQRRVKFIFIESISSLQNYFVISSLSQLCLWRWITTGENHLHRLLCANYVISGRCLGGSSLDSSIRKKVHYDP